MKGYWALIRLSCLGALLRDHLQGCVGVIMMMMVMIIPTMVLVIMIIMMVLVVIIEVMIQNHKSARICCTSFITTLPTQKMYDSLYRL